MMPPSGYMLSPSAAFMPPSEGVIPPSVVDTSLKRIMPSSENMVHPVPPFRRFSAALRTCHLALRSPMPPSESIPRLASPLSVVMLPHLERNGDWCRPLKHVDALRSYHASRAPDVAVTMPRACKRQTQRANAPAENAEEHYRLSIFLPVVDAVTSELTRRFPDSHPGKDLLVIPSRLGEVKTVLTAAEAYEADLPSPTCLGSELVSWRVCWAEVTDVDRR